MNKQFIRDALKSLGEQGRAESDMYYRLEAVLNNWCADPDCKHYCKADCAKFNPNVPRTRVNASK